MLGWRGMVGLIVPSNNNVVMPEFYSALPEGVTAYETRMRVSGDLTFEVVRKMIDDAGLAAELLRQTGVDFICYCCMGSTIIKGWDWERQILGKLADHAPKGIASANSALRDALISLGARRVALVTPYPETLNALIPDFFAAGGFEVKAIAGMPTLDVAEVRWLSPDRVYRTARSLEVKDVDAVCLLATDMQTFPIIEALERDLGVPVLTSNQALIWASLRALGVEQPVEGLGELLRRPRAERQPEATTTAGRARWQAR
jgi:maleate isomerase